MNSCLYRTGVAHIRHRPMHHAFRYGGYAFYLDLEELEVLEARMRLFGLNRARPVSFRDADHVDGCAGSTRAKILSLLDDRGIDLGGGRVMLLTQCRLYGYVFNPISLYYCHDADDALAAVVAEVNNTFGERLLYVLGEVERVPDRDGRRCYDVDKQLHVSPFVSMDARYHFAFAAPGDKLGVTIHEDEAGAPFFEVHWWGRREVLDDRALAKLLLRHPFATAKVTAAIHWQALKLWRLGARVYPQPEPSKAQSAQEERFAQLPSSSRP